MSFSDGLLDLFDDTVETAVAEVLAVTRSARSASAVIDHFAALARRSDLSDDVTLLAFRRRRRRDVADGPGQRGRP